MRQVSREKEMGKEETVRQAEDRARKILEVKARLQALRAAKEGLHESGKVKQALACSSVRLHN